jgi:hypothetical protein
MKNMVWKFTDTNMKIVFVPLKGTDAKITQENVYSEMLTSFGTVCLSIPGLLSTIKRILLDS